MTASAPLALEPPGKGWVGRCVLATRRWCEGQLSTLIALAITCVAFGAFVAAAGHNPFAVYSEMYRGAFGTWFSFQNSLLRAAPLMLTGLCTALPARLGLVVIGGEGALVIGGMAAAATAAALRGAPPALVIP